MHYVEPLIGILNWRYDRATGRLSLQHDSAVVHKLEPRLHHLLNYFLQHPDQIVSKDQLMDDVWPEGEGTDAAVMRAVASLRKILQPGLDEQPCIETLSKRGYRWLLPVSELKPLTIEKVVLQRASEDEVVNFPTVAETKVSTTVSLPVKESLLVKEASLRIEPQRQHNPASISRLLDRRLIVSCFLVFIVAMTLLIWSWLPADTAKLSPVYSQQHTISALAGNEVAPKLTADQQSALYHYQLPPQDKWRWIKHDLSNNRQLSSKQAFDHLSQAVWLDSAHFLFQAQQQQQCRFYLQSVDRIQQEAAPVFSCDNLIRHGLVNWQDSVYWLSVAPDQRVQLWRRPAAEFQQPSDAKAELIYQFDVGYRRAQQLIQFNQHLYLLVEKDFATTSLFSFDPQDSAMVWLQDFHVKISHLSGWQAEQLLLATSQGPILYDLKSTKLQRLNTAQGVYSELYPMAENILAVSLLDGTSDILPFTPNAIQDVAGISQWLNSNKNEYQLAALQSSAATDQIGKLAFVSERTGIPQIWLQQQDKLQQLTNLTTSARISQLLWHQQKLFALIDGVLHEISLSDGKHTEVPIGKLSRVLSCQQQLYWTAWSASGWSLFRFDTMSKPEKIRDGVVDARCGPDGQLVLLPFAAAAIELWQPGASTTTALPIQLNWRQHSADHWLTTESGLFWLKDDQLWFFDWAQQKTTQVETLEPFTMTEIYQGTEQEQIYIKKINELQADVIWLNPAN